MLEATLKSGKLHYTWIRISEVIVLSLPGRKEIFAGVLIRELAILCFAGSNFEIFAILSEKMCSHLYDGDNFMNGEHVLLENDLCRYFAGTFFCRLRKKENHEKATKRTHKNSMP